MKRSSLLLFLLLSFTAACRQNEVVVQAMLTQTADEETRALADLPVRLLPYDRDAIFDSLEAVHPDPEPAIPADLLQQQQQIQEAERRWRTAEDRWTEVRDSLRTLGDALQRMQAEGLRATPQYNQSFQAWDRLDGQVRQLEQRSQSSFREYDTLQRTFLARADSIRVVREQWADRAFADFDRVVTERLRRSGREEYADTTDASGVTRFRGIPQGRWWAFARYTLLFEELYWNVPVEVSGDSVGVVLTRENAQVRPAGM
jgi:hypothetical protein